ncbi:MAG: OmpH family outer membrane protein [Sphingorhabdus sp.]
MTFKFNTLAAVAIAAATISPNTAQAQVAGIATADTVQAIAQAKAFGTAYTQINNTYASYNQQIQAKSKEVNDLNAQLDTNKDKVLDQAELDAAVKAKNPVLQQLDQKKLEIQQLQAPIVTARIYAIEEIGKKYEQAQKNVIAAKKIRLILAPDAFLWAPPEVDVTKDIAAELDRLIPSVGTTPPTGWKPSRQGAAVYQQIIQLLGQVARAQAAQAAQQPPQPAAQPASR